MNEIMMISDKNAIQSFFKVNFGELTDSINKLGEKSSELTEAEKKDARTIIDAWEDTVIRQLRDKAGYAKRIVRSIEYSGEVNLTDDELCALANQVGADDKWDEIVVMNESIRDLETLKRNVENRYIDVDMTIPENVKLSFEKDYEISLYEVKIRRAVTKRNFLIKNLMDVIRRAQSVKSFMNEARKFVDNVSVLETEARNKSQKARINVSISSEGVREALFDLLAFTA